VRHVFVAEEFSGASVRVPDSPLAVGAHESVQHRVQELLPAGLHHLQPVAEASQGEDRAECPRQRFEQVREALRVGFVHDPNGEHAADRIVRTSRTRAPPPLLVGHFGSIAPGAAGAVEKALVDAGFRRRGIEQRKGDPTAIRGEIGPGDELWLYRSALRTGSPGARGTPGTQCATGEVSRVLHPDIERLSARGVNHVAAQSVVVRIEFRDHDAVGDALRLQEFRHAVRQRAAVVPAYGVAP
jgi:hypothetical protein